MLDRAGQLKTEQRRLQARHAEGRLLGQFVEVDRLDFIEQRKARREKGVHLLGPALEEAIARTLDSGGQVLLLLNRRGYANYIACPDQHCGWVMTCDHCDVTMVYHKDRQLPSGGFVQCHHCQAEQKLPAICPDCGRKHGQGLFETYFTETGASPRVMSAWADATHYISAYHTSDTNLRVYFNDGGGVHFGNWNVAPGEIVAGTTYLMEIKYTASQMELLVDGVQRILIATTINFGTIPSTIYWGSDNTQARQTDGVFANPTP